MVSQGTVLGPILFKLYVNSIIISPVSVEITSFINDTVLFFKSDIYREDVMDIRESFALILLLHQSKHFKILINEVLSNWHP